MRQQQKHAGKPPLTRIEKLVDQVFFNPAVAGQKIRHEQFRKCRLVVKRGLHGLFCNGGDDAIFDGGGGRDAQRVAVHAAFTKELAGSQNPDHGLLIMLGYYRKLNLALLNVIDRVRSVALQEHVLILLKFKDRLAYAHPGEKLLSVKRELCSHPNLLCTEPNQRQAGAQYSLSPKKAEGSAV